MRDGEGPAATGGTERGNDASAEAGQQRLRRRPLLRAAAVSGAVTGVTGCLGGGNDPDEAPETPTMDDQPTATPTATATATPDRDCDSHESLSQSDVDGGVTLSEGCYRIDSVHTVDSGTLTLEPGVVIEFGEDAGLDIANGGALRSNGTAQRPVFLQGGTAQRAHWRGVGFTGDGTNSNVVTHTVVAHAGSEPWTGDRTTTAALFVTGATVDIRNVTLHDNGGKAVLARDGDGDLAVSETVFESNELPIRLHANLVGGFESSNVLQHNDDDRVTVLGRTETARDEISTDQEWADPGVPFYVPQDLRSTASLTIGPGTTFEFGAQKGLDVDGGQLTVAGTQDEPVRFRGDTSEQGFWQGIRLRNSTASNRIEYTLVRDAGGALWHGSDYSKAGVFVQGDDATTHLDRCTIANNDVCGLTATGTGYDLTVERCAFEENVEPIRVPADLVQGIAADNAYSGNDGSYVRVGLSGARTNVLRAASWPAHDVPYRLDRDLSVRADLEIAPGTTVEADHDEDRRDTVTIDVPGEPAGSLTADASGPDEPPILFTGSSGEPGHWGGIHFSTESSNNALRDVVVEYGGGELNNGDLESKACVVAWNSGVTPNVALEDVTLRGSARHGIYKGCAATISCRGLRFEDLDGANIWDAGEDGPVSGCAPTC